MRPRGGGAGLAAFLALCLAAILFPAAARAGACAAAAARAEQAYGLPPGLLAAIGQVETGGGEPPSLREGWPWSVGEAAGDRVLDNAIAAAALVRQRLDAGVRSLDVGCFQINLAQHPAAFASLDDAFDPDRNAAAAARFLIELRAELGSWQAAAAAYHSRTPAIGAPYLQRVLAAWREGGAANASARSVPRPDVTAAVASAEPAARILFLGPRLSGLPRILRGWHTPVGD